jgi:pimeloyl-ACP methyl ester carboxylesterase
MNKIPLFTLAVVVTICLLVTAGCTSTSAPASSTPAPVIQPQTQATQQYPAVSIGDTPVQYKEVNGIRLAYREFGAGEPLLMITGFGNTMDQWNATFIGILATKYHVYTYDNRGMGYSGDDHATPTIRLYADDAAGMIPALGYDSMHVYGVSMGSVMAQQLTIDHPERVRKLVLDSNAYSIRIPETQLLFTIINETATNPDVTDGVREEALANLAWNGSWDGLSGIHKDVMLVVGTSDRLTPDPVSVRMAGQINGSWLVRFRGVPHAGSSYAPVQYGENALDFLGMDESPLTT